MSAEHSEQRGLSESQAARLLIRLANLPDNQAGAFRREWKLYSLYKDEALIQLRDELRLLWGHRSIYEVDIRIAEDPPLADDQSKHTDKLLRLAYRCGSEPMEKIICENWLRRDRWALEVRWTPKQKRFRVSPLSLAGTLACACARYGGYLKVCQNFETERYRKNGLEKFRVVCGNRSGTRRYFIARRLDQRFCSVTCADFHRAKMKYEWWQRNKALLNRKRRKATLPGAARSSVTGRKLNEVALGR
jgi:hypothetical protein